jgi:hypothetical protein
LKVADPGKGSGVRARRRHIVAEHCDRGAAVMQYALLVTFVMLVVIGTLVFLFRSAEDGVLSLRRETEGPPDAGPNTTGGGDVGGSDPGSVQVSCQGSTCTFALDPPPASPPAWSIDPADGYVGTPPTVTFTTTGTHTVRATVGDTTVATTVTCTDAGGGLTCG